MSSPLKGIQLSEETKKKLSEAGKKRIGNKNGFYGKKHSEETKKRISDARKGGTSWNKGKSSWRKGTHLSAEHKQILSESQMGEKNNVWNGGASFDPYCHKFNEKFKESVRDKFNRECFLCGKTEIKNGKKLSVHHVNYDKNCLCGDTKCEFVPLCQSCHSKTNHDREYYEKLIMKKLNAVN